MTDTNNFNLANEKLALPEILQKAWSEVPGQKIISFSGQIEDVIIIDSISKLGLPCRFYTLDTGRLHEDTYRMFDKIKFKYNIDLEVYFPDAQAIRGLTKEKGLYSFKESVANRKECCHIRKVVPNKLALAGTSLWITGLRRQQSPERAATPLLEYDNDLKLHKLSPLIYWSWEETLAYARANRLYLHPLYEKGYPSIGCEPCTRAIAEGEDLRAGRWWWENADQKECGLHTH